jgi:hypothetical protein
MEVIMKILFFILFTNLIVLNLQASDVCNLDVGKTVVNSEALVPAWNEKLQKTMEMIVSFTNFTSPYPDFVQLHVVKRGACKKLTVVSVNIYRQIGPQNNRNDSKWEDRPFKKLIPKFQLFESLIILRDIPVEEVLDSIKFPNHVWSLKYEIEYKNNENKRSGFFIIDSPVTQ